MSLALFVPGTAVPSTRIDREKAQALAHALCGRRERAEWLSTVFAGAGITTRHLAIAPEVVEDVLAGSSRSGSVFLPTGQPGDRGPTTAQRMQTYALEAAPLALEASRRALAGSTVSAGEVTHLVTVSCTGFFAPGVDVALVREVPLPSTAERTHVGFMGCHAALNGLRVAHAFAAADPRARVLVCAVELCSLHYHYGWDPQKIVANSLFADGAAAVVGVPAAAAPAAAWRLEASGSCLVPDSQEAMTWRIGDHGFEMTLSKRVPSLIATHLRPFLRAWLERQGLDLSGVASYAVHPGGPRIVDAVEEALGLSARATAPSRETLDENGNMSSPTLLFVLERLMRAQAPRPCVALGFGPGLNVEAALFR